MPIGGHLDPVQDFGDPGKDTWIVGSGTTDAPGGDPNQRVGAVLELHQWT